MKSDWELVRDVTSLPNPWPRVLVLAGESNPAPIPTIHTAGKPWASVPKDTIARSLTRGSGRSRHQLLLSAMEDHASPWGRGTDHHKTAMSILSPTNIRAKARLRMSHAPLTLAER
jgi:hypothetical protein